MLDETKARREIEVTDSDQAQLQTASRIRKFLMVAKVVATAQSFFLY